MGEENCCVISIARNYVRAEFSRLRISPETSFILPFYRVCLPGRLHYHCATTLIHGYTTGNNDNIYDVYSLANILRLASLPWSSWILIPPTRKAKFPRFPRRALTLPTLIFKPFNGVDRRMMKVCFQRTFARLRSSSSFSICFSFRFLFFLCAWEWSIPRFTSFQFETSNGRQHWLSLEGTRSALNFFQEQKHNSPASYYPRVFGICPETRTIGQLV